MNSLEVQLEHEYEATSRMHDLLSQEYQALLNRDIPGLEALVRAKHELISRLERVGRDRDAALSELGLPRGFEGVASYLKQHPSSASAGNWEKLLLLLASCRDQNQLNGGLAETNGRYVQKTLSILQGQSLEPDAYGPTGRTAGPTIKSNHYSTI